jgi:hypothetical protein
MPPSRRTVVYTATELSDFSSAPAELSKSAAARHFFGLLGLGQTEEIGIPRNIPVVAKNDLQ